MVGIGRELTKARTEQGFSIDEMQRKTNIQVEYLRSLEAEQFENLPSRFYARGFLRAYAKSLKLDSQHLLDLYDKQSGNHSEDSRNNQQGSVKNHQLAFRSGNRQLLRNQHEGVDSRFTPRSDAQKEKKGNKRQRILWWGISIFLIGLFSYIAYTYVIA